MVNNYLLGTAGVKLIQDFEGFRSEAYVSKPDMKWTIGYGNTGKLSDGTPVVQGLTITKERAAQEIVILAKRRYGNHVNEVIKRKIKQNEFDALVSLAWNRGSLTTSLINAVNKGDNQAIVDSFMRVSTSKGQVLKGLVRRRKAEIDVYFNGVSQPSPSFDPSSGLGGTSQSGGNCYANTTNPVSTVNATASSGGSISASGSAKIEGTWSNGGNGGPYIKRLKNEADGPQGQNGKLNESNLVKISNGSNNKLIAPAAAAFENLHSALKAAGFTITVSSSYRTYDEQIKIANKNKPPANGKSKAASAGSSSHGWGRAIDIYELYGKDCGRCSSQFNTKLYEWMFNNAHKYKWINPPWATNSTCTDQCEPWHWEFLMDSAAENPALDGAAPYSGSGYKDSCSSATNYVSEAELSAALEKISNFLVTGSDTLTTNTEIANSTDKPLDKDSKKTEAGKDVAIKTILKPEHEKDSLIISKNKEVTSTGDDTSNDEDTSAKPD